MSKKNKNLAELIKQKINIKKDFFQNWYETEGKDDVDEKINKATQLAFDDSLKAVDEAVYELKKSNETKTWEIIGYKGYYDCDGPTDYNFELTLEMDKTITMKEIEEIVKFRYSKYRVLEFKVKEIKD